MVLSGVWQRVQEMLREMTQRLGLRGAALANEDGLLLASASCEQELDPEWMAAVSPLVKEERGELREGLLRGLHERGLSMRVIPISMGGQSLYLCAAAPDAALQGADFSSFSSRIGQHLR